MSEATKEKLQDVFKQLDALVKSASKSAEEEGSNRDLLLSEFTNFFDIAIAGQSRAKPLGIWSDASSQDWNLANNSKTATMSACGSWRSLVTANPLSGTQSYSTVQVHALRTLAIGVTTAGMPENYVGDSDCSWCYQSTGHMLHAGDVVEGHLAPSFARGDYIGVLVDKKQRYIAFYKNGRMAGVPFTDIDTEKPLRLVISCYTGPCSISVNLSPLASQQIQSIMTFPIYIDQDAQSPSGGRAM